ncbi:MAG: hypothetical protein MUE34_12905 [Acidimicrobiales bacterium]|jgi:hypothetical protein|nr:hypothetical protein [Acidimicrobiales bacterium]
MDDALHVATRKGLFVLEGSGADARITGRHFLGDTVPLTMADQRDGAWYAVLDHGHFGCKLHRSDDRGATWDEVAVPEYPPKPEGFVDIDMWGRERDWALMNIWALEPALDADGALWCGTIPGGLFRSEDRGASWQLVESLWNHESRPRWNGGGADQPAIHSICVDPRDPSHVVVAVSSGGVWRTLDAGATWQAHTRGMVAGYVPPEQAEDPENQDPHCVVQGTSDPTVFWCQHHMGIFRSGDDLGRWEQLHVEPSSFGFAVAVDPHDADTAWFVPSHSDQKRAPIDGRVVVTRTRDGGRTFEVLTEGLPQTDAYDLVLRHALDVAADGRGLAFGSTSGNLWVSADGGDRWHAVAHHLPPVYSVRWA